MDLNLRKYDLDPSNRIDNIQSSKTKPRPVIVKFVRYNDRRKVFSMEGSSTSITESLTPFPMELLTKAGKEFGFTNFWPLDGQISYMRYIFWGIFFVVGYFECKLKCIFFFASNIDSALNYNISLRYLLSKHGLF